MGHPWIASTYNTPAWAIADDDVYVELANRTVCRSDVTYPDVSDAGVEYEGDWLADLPGGLVWAADVWQSQ